MAMAFQFSLRRMLTAVVLVAATIAALVNPNALWAGCLWSLSLGISAYALLAAMFWAGRQRACAAGFAIFAATYLVTFWQMPELLPTKHLVYALGGPRSMSSVAQQWLQDDLESKYAQKQDTKSSWQAALLDRQIAAIQGQINAGLGAEHFMASAHAVAVVLAGCIGSISGAHVWATRDARPL